MTTTVVLGVAGSGKTHYGIGIVEQAVKAGWNAHHIGFSSYSLAACREAATRAAGIMGCSPIDLNKKYFCTVHAAVKRELGVDNKRILEHTTAAGEKFLLEHLRSKRGGEYGTQAWKLDQALETWDLTRSKLLTLQPPIGIQQRAETGSNMDSSASRGNNHSDDHSSSYVPGVPDARTRSPIDYTGGNFPQLVRTVDSTQCEIGQGHGASRATLEIDSGPVEWTCREPSVLIGEATENDLVGHSKSRMESFENTSDRSLRVVPWTCLPNSHTYVYPSAGPLGGPLDNPDWPHGPVLQDHANHDNITLGKMEKYRPLIAAYERAKRTAGLVDFADILLQYTGIQVQDDLTLLQGTPLGLVPRTVGLWLFDEYQDSSPLLARASQRLSQGCPHIYLLGDSQQAIFAFAGSSSAIFEAAEAEARATGNRIVLNKTYRNPDAVIAWGEEILAENPNYESRNPYGECGDGSVGLIEQSTLYKALPDIAGTDTLIVARVTHVLRQVTDKLDAACVPWRSSKEKMYSPWDCPARIEFIDAMRTLAAGGKISEASWRRVTSELKMKYGELTIFKPATKSRLKDKEVCASVPSRTLEQLDEWGATEDFGKFLRSNAWLADVKLQMVNSAIDKHGIAEVRQPSVRVGTVHSVKGLEARNVFCLEESSKAATVESDKHEERHLKYVAVTRASSQYRLVVKSQRRMPGAYLFTAAPKGADKFVPFADFGPKLHTEDTDKQVWTPGEPHMLLGQMLSGTR